MIGVGERRNMKMILILRSKLRNLEILTLSIVFIFGASILHAQEIKQPHRDKKKSNRVTGQWYDYGKIVVLRGVLDTVHTFGPPNYGENPETDAKVIYFTVNLRKPISIRGNPNDEFNRDTIRGISRIQIKLYESEKLLEVLGKRIKVKGKLWRQSVGSDYTGAVIDIEKGDIEFEER